MVPKKATSSRNEQSRSKNEQEGVFTSVKQYSHIRVLVCYTKSSMVTRQNYAAQIKQNLFFL